MKLRKVYSGIIGFEKNGKFYSLSDVEAKSLKCLFMKAKKVYKEWIYEDEDKKDKFFLKDITCEVSGFMKIKGKKQLK